MQIRRQQVPRDANIRRFKLRHWLQLHPGRPFLLKFMVIIYTAYATMKMSKPKGIITIKVEQLDALACENTSLSHVGQFGNKAALDQATKAAKTQGGNAPSKTSSYKLPTSSTPRASTGTTSPKGVNIALASTLPPAYWKMDKKKKGITEDEDNKEVLADPNDLDKKFKISLKLDPK
jgi:hypothetical protein